VQDVLGRLKVAIEESHAQIAFEGLPAIRADTCRSPQVFQNLIGNALKFHGEGAPEIHIGAERKNDKWVFASRTTASASTGNMPDRVFQMFQRLHERGRYTGSGIGLAIAKKIVERHGGRIWFDSKPEHGTTFYFHNTCHPGRTRMIGGNSRPSSSRTMRGCRPDARNARLDEFDIKLSSPGTASRRSNSSPARRNGPEADHPTLILLDLNLPRKDGRQVLSILKGQDEFRRIPVIILSSSDSDRDVTSCYNLGANCYIVKPVISRLDLKLGRDAIAVVANRKAGDRYRAARPRP